MSERVNEFITSSRTKKTREKCVEKQWGGREKKERAIERERRRRVSGRVSGREVGEKEHAVMPDIHSCFSRLKSKRHVC